MTGRKQCGDEGEETGTRIRLWLVREPPGNRKPTAAGKTARRSLRPRRTRACKPEHSGRTLPLNICARYGRIHQGSFLRAGLERSPCAAQGCSQPQLARRRFYPLQRFRGCAVCGRSKGFPALQSTDWKCPRLNDSFVFRGQEQQPPAVRHSKRAEVSARVM